tara:strand:+ start:1417 stop:1851 length:435 start_codon:yes stop_codon:yes gene_type:complete
MRQHDLWWHDLEFLVKQVAKQKARPWGWLDYVWHHPDDFYSRMPESVLQSNWYYGKSFANSVTDANAYKVLEEHSYNQIPTGSNWSCPENFQRTVSHARKHISTKRLLGFLQTVWRPTIEESGEGHIEAIELAARARKNWERGL